MPLHELGHRAQGIAVHDALQATARPYFATGAGGPRSGILQRTCLRKVPSHASHQSPKISSSFPVKRRQTKVKFNNETFITLINSRDATTIREREV